jgi:hypothetical protein
MCRDTPFFNIEMLVFVKSGNMGLKNLQIFSDTYPDILERSHSHGSRFRLAEFLDFLYDGKKPPVSTHIFFLVVESSTACNSLKSLNNQTTKINL